MAPPVDKKQSLKTKRAPPSTGWRTLNACFVLPAIVLVFLRGGDSYWYDEALCNAVGPGAILAGTVAWSAAMVHSSSRNPAKATMMGFGLFAAVKQRADSVPPPKVSSANSNNNQPMLSLVTGANSGIGHALSLELARQGHFVLMACRSQKRCEDAKATLVEELVAEAATNEDDDTGGVKDGLAALAALRASLEAQVVPVGGMDLSNTQAMVEFARGPVATAATQLRSISSSSLTSSSSSSSSSPSSAPAAAIDLLVLNAGFIPAGNTTFPLAGGGWEAGLGAMHLGHFALVTTLAEMGLVSSSSSSSSSGSEMGEVVKSAGGGGDGGGARNGGSSSSGSANNNIKGEEGTVAIVVSSDLSRLGGFHESILTSIHRKTSGGDGSMQQQQGEGSQQGGSKQAQGYEGDLRGEVTNALWSLGPWRIVPNSQGLLNVHSGMPDGVSFGAYSRSKLANVFFARELERRRIVGTAVSVHPGNVYTSIVELSGAVKVAQELLSPLFLRSPPAAANVVLSSAYGPAGVLAKKNKKEGSSSLSSSFNAADSKYFGGSSSSSNSNNSPAMVVAEGAADPWLHFANGRGEVLGPRALAYKSVELNDKLAKALWEASEGAVSA